MSSPFSRSLRAIESERTRSWRPFAVAAALLLGWTGWFLLAQVPLYETSSSARIESVDAAHPVDARMAGRAIRVDLPVGARVRAGDVLVELEADAERLARDEARARLAALTPEIAAVRLEVAAEERAIADERRASTVAVLEQRAIVREAQAAADLASDEARRTARLLVNGIVTVADDQRARAAMEQRRAAAEAAGAALARVEQEQKTRESDRVVRIQRLRSTLTRLEGEAATAAATVRRLEYDVERRVLRAPIDGRIAEAAADLRVGAVVDEGDRLAAIVPEGLMRVVAQLPPASAIGRVRPGQPALVRLLGFPWAEYGTVRASVARVAAEVRDGSVRVELDVGALPETLPMTHAIPASVEIEVERVRPAWLVLRTLGGLLTRTADGTALAAPGS
jgi:membrane fusion protein (multidrug efflux system)